MRSNLGSADDYLRARLRRTHADPAAYFALRRRRFNPAVQGKYATFGNWMWPKLIIACIAFLIYTNLVWQNRRDINQLANYPIFTTIAASRWEMRPSPWLDEAVRDGKLPAGQAMDWLSIGMYVTHSPTTVQQMADHWRDISIYGGLYQVGILSPITDVLAPSLKLSQKMRSELMSTGIYGWFPTAWGAWIGDTGLLLGTLCVFYVGGSIGIGLSCRSLGSLRKNSAHALRLPI